MIKRLFDLADIGRQIIAARQRWRSLDSTRLAQFQDQRAQQIIRYAQQHAAFYRQHWANYQLSDWRNLPLINKQLMMEHFDQFNTLGISREQAMNLALRAEQERDFSPTLNGITVGLSSGTSGYRGLFLVSPNEQRAWAGTILSRLIHHLDNLPIKVAFFLRSNSQLYQQVGSKQIQFRYFDLMLPIEQAVQQLNQFQPSFLIGPPSLLMLLAQQNQLAITPQRLISVAEVLEPHDQQALTERFGAPVYQVYQCTEGLLAISCAHGRLHIQEDLVAIQAEYIDEQRFYPIITDLWRTTQPIIRYRLNDILSLSPEPCPCGSHFRIIERIEGRSDDICQFPQSDGTLRAIFPDTIRRMILLAHDDILDYQAIQSQDGQLTIYLETKPHADWPTICYQLKASVERILAEYGCTASLLEILPGIPARQADHKRRRVQRKTDVKTV